MMVIERRATRLIDQMLPYICESPVQVAMLALLFFPTVQHDMKIKRQECYSRLQEMGFLEKVLGFLELKGNTELFFLALLFYFFFFVVVVDVSKAFPFKRSDREEFRNQLIECPCVYL